MILLPWIEVSLGSFKVMNFLTSSPNSVNTFLNRILLINKDGHILNTKLKKSTGGTLFGGKSQC